MSQIIDDPMPDAVPIDADVIDEPDNNGPKRFQKIRIVSVLCAFPPLNVIEHTM
jgi:hypothetical protein